MTLSRITERGKKEHFSSQKEKEIYNLKQQEIIFSRETCDSENHKLNK